MSDINWSMMQIPNYDMTDLRQSKSDAWQNQAELAGNISKAIAERRKQMEEDAKEGARLVASVLGGSGGNGGAGLGTALGAIFA